MQRIQHKSRSIYPVDLGVDHSLDLLSSICSRLGISRADAIRDAISHYADYLEGLEVVEYRDISLDKAKEEIKEFIKDKDRISADEISNQLRIDMSLVNEALTALWNEGMVEPDE